ncbi:hypothetical protein CRM22_008429 [Opisthorchis felineus]|uniref:Uncharacterized protein n=1 Tax=Opisthorchis felineus TaxID=147828 RepID=A0A4S2LB75_OPIFE|nr:hypothetical protein CRM22_008429 [Opisthorchis felineus]
MTPEEKELLRVRRYTSGVQNQHTFHEHHHNRGAVSHQWRGPAYYIPGPQARYLHLEEFKNTQEQELVLYRNNHWCRYNPPEAVKPHNRDPLHLVWPRRPVFYSAHHNKWLNEHADTLIPRDARLFYNEEDWIKYKHMVETAKLPAISLTNIACKQNLSFQDFSSVGRRQKTPFKNGKFFF